ncbi:MAG: hypothetical protein V2A73_06700, partial [Pseudomonadota bacterium]
SRLQKLARWLDASATPDGRITESLNCAPSDIACCRSPVACGLFCSGANEHRRSVRRMLPAGIVDSESQWRMAKELLPALRHCTGASTLAGLR